MKKNYKTPFALAMGASLLPFAATIVHAEANPFALSELDSAYMQTAEAKPDQSGAAKMKDGACGEGKCGAAMAKPAATDKNKSFEGKCAGNMAKPAGDSQKPSGNSSGNK